MTELLNLEEAAKELHLSIYTIRSWIFQRRLAFVRLGRRVMLRKADVEKLINDGLVLPKKEN